MEGSLHMIVHISSIVGSCHKDLKPSSLGDMLPSISLVSYLFSVSFKSQFTSFELSTFSHVFQFEFLTVLAHMVRHLVYGVLDTSKELPSPIRPMLVSEYVFCH